MYFITMNTFFFFEHEKRRSEYSAYCNTIFNILKTQYIFTLYTNTQFFDNNTQVVLLWFKLLILSKIEFQYREKHKVEKMK